MEARRKRLDILVALAQELDLPDVAQFIMRRFVRCDKEAENSPSIGTDGSGTCGFPLADASLKSPSVRLMELRSEKRQRRQRQLLRQPSASSNVFSGSGKTGIPSPSSSDECASDP